VPATLPLAPATAQPVLVFLHLPPIALTAWVLGDVALQSSGQLPAQSSLATLLVVAVFLLALAPAWAHWRRHRTALAGAVLGAFMLGFACAGLQAQARLADALEPALEGVELRVRGVVASLPEPVEGGWRMDFTPEQAWRMARAAEGSALASSPAASTLPASMLPASTLPAAAGADRALAQAAVLLPSRLSMAWYGAPPELLPAQRWELTLRLRRPHAGVNPAGFDAEAWLFAQGVRAMATVRNGPGQDPPRCLATLAGGFSARVDRLRAQLRGRLQALLQGRPSAPVLVALVMGDQAGIDDADWSRFNRSGISHLISISGLHITLIAALAGALGGVLWRRSARLLRRASLPVARAGFGMAAGLAYCMLAGWGVPAQRTLLMLAVVAAGLVWRVHWGSATLLALAAALVCLWDPWAVLAAGFWLSFGAVACLMLASAGRPPADPGWRANLREACRLQAGISVGQVPFTLAIFGQVSLVAPLANAVAIPLVSYAVAPLALVGAALASLGLDAAASALLGLAGSLFACLEKLIDLLLAPAWSAPAFALPPVPAFAFAAAGTFWLLAPPGWPWRPLGLLWLLPLLCWPQPRPLPGQAWLTALDVGQGMALVLETPGRTLVFDAGPRYSPQADAGGRVVLPYLRARGIQRIDLLVISHPDADHAGGTAALRGGFQVDALWSSMPPGHRLLGPGADPHRCVAGERLDLGELQVDVLSPPASLYDVARATTNARSCVLRVRAGGRTLLLTGDVPARQERELVRNFPPGAIDVLVAPHHGSHTSSSQELLDATRPAWVSMQLGYRNRFGHPHREVLARYALAGARVVRSDEAGAARWVLAPGDIGLERWRQDHPRYWRAPEPPSPAIESAHPITPEEAGHG
jgi:competence protein ComEC